MTGAPPPLSWGYCGPAPEPDSLWRAWNGDPPLLIALGLLLLLVVARGGRAAFGGWAVLVIAFVSPVCALSVGLFSARAAHHMLLIAVAAPLLALALAGVQRPRLPAAAAFVIHAVALWFWHAPVAYSAALGNDLVYWAMQVTILSSAIALWRTALAAETGEALAVLLGATAQMGLLGALLLFAPSPLYVEHLTTTEVWGLSPLHDQQIAGLVMWVLAGLPYLGVAAAIAWRAASVTGRTPA